MSETRERLEVYGSWGCGVDQEERDAADDGEYDHRAECAGALSEGRIEDALNGKQATREDAKGGEKDGPEIGQGDPPQTKVC